MNKKYGTFLAPFTFPFLDLRTYLGTTQFRRGLLACTGEEEVKDRGGRYKPLEGPARRAPPGASRVFSSRNYPRQVTAPSSRFYDSVDPADGRVAKNLCS